jgi:anti-sigma regulatory factor (Ser/Thr protein kinase)
VTSDAPSAKIRRNTITTKDVLDLTSEADLHNARRLRLCFREWLRTLGTAAPLIDDLTLAVYEAIANVVEHAYHPEHPHPVMRLQACLEGDQLLITITDHGCWRAPQAPGYRGRGLAMMRSLTTEVHLHPTAHGTTVYLRAGLHHRSSERA